MSDRMTAVEAYKNALVKGDPDAVAEHLAADVVVETNFGRAQGPEAVLALLREPRTSGLLAAGAQWPDPVADGDSVTVTAGLPASAEFGGIEFVFAFAGAGAKITRVEQQTLPAAPLRPVPPRLTEEINSAVDGALDNQTPMMIAYTDDSGQTHLSFRGTIQAYSGDRLALWARDPGGGLPRHIEAQPNVTFFYPPPSPPTTRPPGPRTRSTAGPGSRTTRPPGRRSSTTPTRASGRWTSGGAASRSSWTWTGSRAEGRRGASSWCAR